MDWYEHDRMEREKRDREAKHKRELADAEYEREEAARAKERAEQAAEQARRYSQCLKHEYEEEREQYAEELAERVAEVKRLKAEQKLLIDLLRRLTPSLGTFSDNVLVPPEYVDYFAALKEARELLRLIDLAKESNQ